MTNPAFQQPAVAPAQLTEALGKMQLHSSLQDNLRVLGDAFERCADYKAHRVLTRKGQECFLLYMEGLVDNTVMGNDVIEPLVQGEVDFGLERIAAGLTTFGAVERISTVGEAVGRILDGQAVFLIDGAPGALSYGITGGKSRAVSEPTTESTIRGPREGFVERLSTNISLLRRKIKSPALKVETLTIGRITQTDVAVAYIQGIADSAVVREVFSRLKRVDMDGVLEGGYLEEFLEDSPFSPFPQVQNTERPDTAAGQLLEGRVAILVDGTPFVLVVPVVFAQFLQSSEDYYERFVYGSPVRTLRFVFMLVALLLPATYVAVTTFHQEMVPTSLFLSVAAAREGVPYPALIEAIIMEISFEILREAGIRLPRPVGQAVSIVGALVIGEAAVKAGLVSAPMVIIVSITGIASFSIPRYNASTAIRLLRFPLMILAGGLGLFGIGVGLSAILLHLCSLRSFGVPYLAPVAPVSAGGLADTAVRAPHWWMKLRPLFISRANAVRASGERGKRG